MIVLVVWCTVSVPLALVVGASMRVARGPDDPTCPPSTRDTPSTTIAGRCGAAGANRSTRSDRTPRTASPGQGLLRCLGRTRGRGFRPVRTG